MKGADQCPKCGSHKWGEGTQGITGFYAPTLRVCKNCATAWEPFDPAALLDEGMRFSSFTEPCDNCAFRPGSNEQADKEKWRALIADISLGANGWPKGEFFCHKGVPLDVKHEHESESGFCYPYKDGKPDKKHLRPCRGYLRMTFRQMQHLYQLEEIEHEIAGMGHA